MMAYIEFAKITNLVITMEIKNVTHFLKVMAA